MKFLTLIAFLLAPVGLSADVTQFEEGQFLTVTARYDRDSDRFMSDIQEGEQNICFRVDGLISDGLVLALVKGTYRPWWGDGLEYRAGDYSETWFTSDAYRDNHPNASTTDELKGMFTAHTTCP